MKNLIISKHWSSYILSVVLVFTFSTLVLRIVTTYDFTKVDQGQSKGLAIFGVLVLSVFILLNIIYILKLRSTKWLLTEEDLILKSGYLPWSKKVFHVKIYNIYESYYNETFLGHYLNYGNITVRRTDGSTSHLQETSLQNVVNFVQQINKKTHQNHNKTQPQKQETKGDRNIIEELKELSNMKINGLLTETEFDTLKQKLIN